MSAEMGTLEQEIETARRRFLAWLEWYRHDRADPDTGEPLSKQELADRLMVVSRSAVSQLMAPGSDRAPSFEMLVSAARLIGLGYNTILAHDPPPIRARRS